MEELEVGDIIKGRYRLVKFLGNGGFGEVWLAFDSLSARDVALKIYMSLDPSGVEEFQREYANSVDLNSPYLLKIDYYDIHNRRPFLVMRYCECGSSSQFAGKVTEDQLWTFVYDVANGLKVLHSQVNPIVHQDIKPDNILVNENNHFVITDFGISKRLRATMRRYSRRDVSSGSMPYMAPERFDGTPRLTTASDIWSLGVSIYELATGELPFSGFGGSMQRNGADIPSLGSSFSSSLNALMQACLVANPNNRPTAEDLVMAAQRKSFAANVSIGKDNKNVRIVTLFVIVLLLFIGVIPVILNNNSRGVLVSNNNAKKICDSLVSVENADSISVEEKKTKISVPKPREAGGKSDYPFNPAGCPFLYIDGCDTAAMAESKSMDVNIYGREYSFCVGDDHPNGTKVNVVVERYGINLLNSIPDNDFVSLDCFDDFGFLKEDAKIQLTIMDFNDDDECELLLTLCYEIECKTYIFRLLPNPYKFTIVNYLGVADGQLKMYVEGKNIIAPYGSQGLYEEYTLTSNDRIININE